MSDGIRRKGRKNAWHFWHYWHYEAGKCQSAKSARANFYMIKVRKERFISHEGTIFSQNSQNSHVIFLRNGTFAPCRGRNQNGIKSRGKEERETRA